MEDEVEQLKVLVGDLFSKIESLEERVDFLEDRDSAQPKGPEPILTCVQCLAEYKESENAEGYCKYHTGIVLYGFKTKVKCCEATAQSVEQLIPYSGCTKGKHHSKHHTEFLYTNYLIFMRELSKNAEELWVEMEVYDYIAKLCPWAEVGKSKENEIFVVAGFASHRPEVCASLKPQQLTKCKKSIVLFEKNDDTGLSFLKAELVTSGLVAEAIIVTIKTSWSKIPYAKRINFSCKQNNVKFGRIECLSDPRPEKPSQMYSIPEENRTGPVLEPGEDYSQGRRNDYPTVTNDDLFAMEMVQLGMTEVNSLTWGMRDGKWINCFIANIKITNGSLDIVSIQDVLGEYQNEAGEWEKCKKVSVRPTEDRKFLEVNDFLVDGSAPMTIVVQLDIEIEELSPNGNQECQRAHHSLPQPLLLRVTIIDSQKRTASLIFEQGNEPLPLATMESRQANWSKKKPLLFHLCADDVDLRKRSDVAFYYNEDLTYVYRPAPNNEGGTSFYIRDSMLETLAYNAKKTGVKEQELTELAKKNEESKIQVFGVVDLENQFTFALKVVITTPTSSATGHCLLPRKDEIYQATLTVPQGEVEVGSTLTVEWNISQASKNDRLEIHKLFGNNQISMEYNRKEETEGSLKMKVPKSPGEYEVRYYPSCLRSSNTSFGHSICVASAVFTVVPA